MNERERERLESEALDAYLTGLQSGRPQDRPDALPADQASFARELVDLSSESLPDAGFAGQLAAKLRAAARQRARTRRSTRPRPGHTLEQTGRMMGMSRRLVFSLAGAAIMVLILAAVLVYRQNQPAVGPRQVALQPTGTSVPTALATATALPPTQTPVAAQGTRQPAATPTEALSTVVPTPTPAETALPTAVPTPTPMEPFALPALADWMSTGYGGGGGGPIAAGRTYVLDVELPQGPEQMVVYVQREPAELTAASAAEWAAWLGLQGPVYQSIGLAAVDRPRGEPAAGYLAVDGARELLFESSGIVHYTDRNRTSFYEGHWREPEGVPSLEQATGAAEGFLQPAGLLEDAYEIAAAGNTIIFYRVLEGQWPLIEPFARVSVWADGQVGEAQFWPLELDRTAGYPILSAQEAWEILRADPLDGRVWQNLYRSPTLAPWGEWQHANPRFWARPYRPGQEVHRFGVPRTWFPTEEGGAPFVALGELVLTGDVQGLTEYTLQQYAREEWNYVHVWGSVEDAGGYLALRLEGWEPVQETYWYGTIRAQGQEGTLIMDDGRAVLVPDLPADLPDGTQVSISGGMQGDRLEWTVIQEMGAGELPPAATPELQRTVTQVDLVYLALAPNVIPPERFAELSYRAVQPVWRFRGHGDQGNAFEIYVQAAALAGD